MIKLKSFIKNFILLLLFPVVIFLNIVFCLYFSPTLLGIIYFFFYSIFFILFVLLEFPFFKLFKLSKPKNIYEWLIFWNVMLCFYPMAGFGVAEIFFNISNPFVFIPFYFLVYLYFMGCIQSWINDFKDLYASAVIYIFISVPILWIFFGMTSGIGWYLTILWFINILIFMLLPKSS
mgnify:FL=1